MINDKELEKLIDIYGNAEFDCGAWDEEEDIGTGRNLGKYKELFKTTRKHRLALIKYIKDSEKAGIEWDGRET